MLEMVLKRRETFSLIFETAACQSVLISEKTKGEGLNLTSIELNHQKLPFL